MGWKDVGPARQEPQQYNQLFKLLVWYMKEMESQTKMIAKIWSSGNAVILAASDRNAGFSDVRKCSQML